MTGTGSVFQPIPKNQAIYKRLYLLYRQLYDAFGMKEWNGGMYNVMKDLLAIKDETRRMK